MAVIPFTQDNDDSYRLVRWGPLGAGDTGVPLDSGYRFADRTVQIVGALGGATVAITGSMDGVNWSPLTDPQGNALTGVAALPRLEMLTELPRLLRPEITGGSGTTAVTVLLGGRRTIR